MLRMDCCKDPMAMGRVVCPKPRRPEPFVVNTSTAVPLRFHICNDAESKSGAELLGLILKEDTQAERYANLSSSPPFFFGSPPCRAPNPVVHDEHFGDEKLNLICRHSPIGSVSPRSPHAREQLGKKQAAVRVEGFDCPSSRAVAMA